MPLLIISSDDPDTSTVPYHVPDSPPLDENVKSGVAVDDNGLGKKSVMSATAKLLCGVRDSKNTSVPLKSIAGHLYFVLENCQVWPPPCTLSPRCSLLWSFQQTDVDGQAIELLAPRIKILSESLCAPIQPGDTNEKQRGAKLEQ